MDTQPEADIVADLIAHCPEHGTHTETWPECRCAAARQAAATITAATQPEPAVQATEYTVTLLPDDDINAHLYGITVQYRGGGRWAVVHLGSCLGADGTWDYGVKEYDRGDGWLDSHRFDEATALELAKQAAPAVTVNGVTATEALRRRNAVPGTVA